MGKKFFDVFPGLVLDDRTKEIMEQTEVEKVSTTRKQDFIRIYISSNTLIDKTDIYKTETGIKKQLFNGQDLTIKIYEKFSLSAQYTPQNLFDIYRESIEMELKDYDHMEYSLFRAASFEYPDDGNVVIQLEDSVVGKKKAPDLIRVLSKIVNERCGLSVAISPEFVETRKETKEPDYTDESVKMAKKLEDFEQKSEEKKKKAAEKKAQKAVEAEENKTPEVQKSAAWSGKTEFSKGKWTPKRGDFGGSYKRSDNPDVVFGRDFDDDTMKLSDLIGELGEVTVHGKVTAYDQRDIRNEKSIMIFDITDFTDSITVKMFVKTEDVPDIIKDIKPGAFLKIKGIAAVDKFDHELSLQSIVGVKKIPDFTTKRVDTAEVKRVELHCHTKMSDMDGVSEVKDIVKQAYKWGMPGIAITDHGVVQALTDANHVWDDLFNDEKKLASVISGSRQPPAFPCRLQHSIIGRLGLNHRVRDGNGCFPQPHRHRKFFSYQSP